MLIIVPTNVLACSLFSSALGNRSTVPGCCHSHFSYDYADDFPSSICINCIFLFIGKATKSYWRAHSIVTVSYVERKERDSWRGGKGQFWISRRFSGCWKKTEKPQWKKQYWVYIAMSFSRSWKLHYYSWRKELSFFPPFWFRLLWAKVFWCFNGPFQRWKGPLCVRTQACPSQHGAVFDYEACLG